jgi:hypothetical protein
MVNGPVVEREHRLLLESRFRTRSLILVKSNESRCMSVRLVNSLLGYAGCRLNPGDRTDLSSHLDKVIVMWKTSGVGCFKWL